MTQLAVVSSLASFIGCGRIADDQLVTDASNDALYFDVPDSDVFDSAVFVDEGVDVEPDGNDVEPADAIEDSAPEAPPCGEPAPGTLHVAPTGDDSKATGSEACPFHTITAALKTISSGSPLVTINVAPGDYADGCSGGPPCDEVPIVVSGDRQVTVRGTGKDPSEVRLLGRLYLGNSLFEVNDSIATFENLTVIPRADGGEGFRFGGLSKAPTALRNVIILGSIKSWTGYPTGPGVLVYHGADVTIGPGVTISGGVYGVHIIMGSGSDRVPRATIVSAPGARTTIEHTYSACVRIEGLSLNATPTAELTATADTEHVLLSDCGLHGGVFFNVFMNATPPMIVNRTRIAGGTSSAAGIQLLGGASAIVSETTIFGTKGDGIYVDQTSALTITKDVTLSTNGSNGVRLRGSAKASITGLRALVNGTSGEGHGLACAGSASLVLRDSTFLSNVGSGVLIAESCAADLGSSTSAGNNVFNVESRRNGRTGLCYLSSAPAIATNSVWGCGLSATMTCTSAGTTWNPVRDTSAGCSGSADYGIGSSGALGLGPLSAQTCCWTN